MKSGNKKQSQQQIQDSNRQLFIPRRQFIRGAAVASAALAMPGLFATPGLFAEELLTPPMVEGPFYPDALPLDTDNDLLILNDSITPAVGEISHLWGTVRDQNGNAVRNASVEIWQCDGNGVYMHAQGGPREQLDTNFQGFGRFITGINGQYYFRTIKPVAYTGRTPHIHFIVSTGGERRITTQMLIKGHELNDRDGLFRQIQQQEFRDLLMADFVPIEDSTIGELSAQFDITIGITPDEEQMKERRDEQQRGESREQVQTEVQPEVVEESVVEPAVHAAGG